MQLFVVTSKCRAITDWAIPTYADIAAALRSVSFPVDPPYAWVGPPRVVRRAIVGSGFDTYVTAVLRKPDPPPGGRPTTAEQIRSAFGERITRALKGVTTCFDAVGVAPYFDAQNGADLNWWASGQAGQTRTRDAYPTLTGRLIADENPLGPDSASVRLPSAGEAAGQAAGVVRGAAAGILLPIVLVGGAVAAAVYLGPTIALGLSARFATPGKRKNPRDDMLLPTAAVLGLGGLGAYYALRASGASAAAPPATTPTLPARTTPTPVPAPTPAPAPAPAHPDMTLSGLDVLPPPAPATLTDAERQLSNSLLTDTARQLLFYMQSMAYSYRLTDVAPTGEGTADLNRVIRYLQSLSGATQDGVANVGLLRDLRRLLTQVQAASHVPVRVIPMRLWRRAVDAVNNTVLGAAPGALQLQVNALDA